MTFKTSYPLVELRDIVAETQYGTSELANGSDGAFPILRMNNITYEGVFVLGDLKRIDLKESDIGKHTVRRGDLLFNRTNSPELVGKTAVWDSDETFAFAGYLIRVRFDESKACPKYVSAFLNSIYGKRMLFAAAKPSINMSNISATGLLRLKVPLPPLSVQKRISAILDQADAIRRKRRVAGEATAALIPAAFYEVFGDPGANPKGWPVIEMGEVVSESQYGTSSLLELDQRAFPVLRMNNITYFGEWDLSDLKWLDFTDEETPKYTVRKGDLLFNRTNSPELVGKTAVWPCEEAYGFAGYLIRIRFDERRALPDFVSAYLNSTFGKSLLFKSATPSNNMSNLSASTFRRLPLTLPALPLQKKFTEYCTHVRASVGHHQCATGESESLFRTLAHRAFRGGL